MSRRFLITGSRSWLFVDAHVIAAAIRDHMRAGDVLVHGGAQGVDTWAGEMWAPFGPVEIYLARDFPDPKARNLHMISLGADCCLAFANGWASGTGHCARKARAAGIHTIDFGVATSIDAPPPF